MDGYRVIQKIGDGIRGKFLVLNISEKHAYVI